MYKTMIKTFFASILSLLMVSAAFALGGGGASSVEPGDSCEQDPTGEGNLFKRAPGAPFSGNVLVSYDVNTAQATYSGTIVQFGSTCSVTLTGKQDLVAPGDFNSFTGRDLRGLCLKVEPDGSGDCSGLDSVFMEVLTGKQPSRAGPSATVEIMAYPLRIEQ